MSHITMYMGIQKNGMDDLIFKAEIETQREKKNVQIPKLKGGWDELGDWD